jgi:cytochrome c6
MPAMRSALPLLALRPIALLAASASVAFAAGCGSGGSSSAVVQASTGRAIFDEAGCVSCHTLADAGGNGSIGPNLDEEKPIREEVAFKLTKAKGRMPSFKGRLTAKQVETVSEYVSSVAGK